MNNPEEQAQTQLNSNENAPAFNQQKYNKMCADRIDFCVYVQNVVNPSRISTGQEPMKHQDAWACYNLITSGIFRN